MEGEINGFRDEQRRRREVGSSRGGNSGGAYHEKFCSSDLSAEWEPSSIMNIIDLGEIFIHIKWSSTRKCLSVTCRQKPLWGLFQYSVLFVLLVC